MPPKDRISISQALMQEHPGAYLAKLVATCAIMLRQRGFDTIINMAADRLHDKLGYAMNREEQLAEAKRRLILEFKEIFKGVVPRGFDYERIADEFFSEQRAGEQASLISELSPFELRGKRMLEMGSAYGTLLDALHGTTGADAYGVEPAPREFSATIEGCLAFLRFKNSPIRVACGEGEMLPFRSNAFDMVVSWNVLEHVRDLDAVIAEIVRVLAHGGRAVIVVPNYGSWWEGHYGLLWIPHMPRWMAKIYVRLWGRDPQFIDSLQFVTVGWLRKALAPHARHVRIACWGQELWKKRLLEMDISGWGNLAILRRAVQWLHAFRVHRAAAWIGCLFNWQTPIILVFDKTAPS